jgi:IPTL-CTERM motif/Fibronectin type III domain
MITMFTKLFRQLCVVATLFGLVGTANASFHLWEISEVYSNASGTIQFIEFQTTYGGQQFLGAHTLTSSNGVVTNSFTFPSNLPGDTTNKKFLVGTAGFAALGIVTPDYIVPNGFLFVPAGTLNFASVDIFTYASLPTDGSLSLNRTYSDPLVFPLAAHVITTAVNSPTNFAGQSGTIVPPSAPGAPTIGSAIAGNAQATVTFTAPASNGGSVITGYTVTCNPGAVTASGAGSPLTVTGLANGTTYLCSVTATNAAGTGAASATVNVTPSFNSYTAPSATGTGNITASFTGGGPGCSYTTAQFIPLTGNPASPPAGTAPSGVTFPHGLFDFTTSGCTPSSTITLTVTWPSALPAGTQYWKYGPAPGNATPHWYVLPAAIAGNVTTFSITDGALGDDDLLANGTIVDQGGPGGGAGAAGATSVPTLSEWAMIALASLLGFLGMRQARPNG